jgi:hypothetical protein
MSRVIIEPAENSNLLATTVQEAIEHERQLLKHSLDQVQEELAQFEKRFGESSAAFFARYEAGSLGEADDYVDWAGLYRIFQKLRKKLSELEQVELVA